MHSTTLYLILQPTKRLKKTPPTSNIKPIRITIKNLPPAPHHPRPTPHITTTHLITPKNRPYTRLQNFLSKNLDEHR